MDCLTAHGGYQCEREEETSLSVIGQANLPYVIWIAAFNTSFLLAYLLIHTWASTTYKRSSAPAIFEAINRNGLVVFLVVRPLLFFLSLATYWSDRTGKSADGSRQRLDGEHVRVGFACGGRLARVLCGGRCGGVVVAAATFANLAESVLRF